MSIYLSASSIDDFLKCSQKVEYRIKKPFPEVVSKEMLIGKIMHSIFELAWQTKEEAISMLDAEVKANKLSRADHTNMSFMIDMFFLNIQPRLFKEDLVEYKFKIPVYDDIFLVGKIDRISNGTIFDWKTGLVSKNLGSNIQCIVYDFAYKALFSKEPSGVCMVSLKEGALYPYRKNEYIYRELFTKVIPRMIKVVKSEQYEKTGMFTHGCFRCQYKEGCLGSNKVKTDELE
jgi:ATP-dependent helicase/DNAse subunit B